MRVDFSGKVALVTGGGRGIGRAISVALARCGAEVAINYRANATAADETLEEIQQANGRAWTIQADVSSGTEVRSMFDRIRDRFGNRLDILVNNAGSLERSMLADLTEESWDDAMNTNVKSVFLCTQAAVPLLPDHSGRIVNVTSISARSGGVADSLHYGAAKAAVSNFTRGCAKVLAPRGITVNGIAPGVIYTDLHKYGTPKDELASLSARIPLQRLGETADCVGAVLLLCSPMGSYITGEIIEINGGMLMS